MKNSELADVCGRDIEKKYLEDVGSKQKGRVHMEDGVNRCDGDEMNGEHFCCDQGPHIATGVVRILRQMAEVAWMDETSWGD